MHVCCVRVCCRYVKVNAQTDTIEGKPFSITHQDAATVPTCLLTVLCAFLEDAGLKIDEKQESHKPKILLLGASVRIIISFFKKKNK